MTAVNRAGRVVVLGWVVFLLMSVLVVVDRGGDHVANMAVFAALGAAMLTWVVRRGSRAAFVVSLVLGALHTLEQVAYLVAGATEAKLDAFALAVDAVGLISGALLLAGAARALSVMRREPPETVTVDRSASAVR